jgi:branched-chain amino acid transport system permease protein
MSTSLLTSGAILLLVLWPVAFPGAIQFHQVLGLTCLYATLALAWNIYALAGAISLGHAAFFGLGAYASALLNHHCQWTPLLSIPVGALAGVGFAGLWSLCFRRLRGVYLGLASLAALEIPKTIADNWDRLTYGSMGIMGLDHLPNLKLAGLELDFGMDLRVQYYLLLAVMLLAALIHRQTIRSRWGWILRALRENETAATVLGLKAARERALALTLSAYLAGLTGGLYAHLMGLIEPSLVFNLHLSVMPLVFSFFGGSGRVWGPVLGAFILYPLEQLVLLPVFPMAHAAVYGLVIILTIFFFPRGIAAWLPARRTSV